MKNTAMRHIFLFIILIATTFIQFAFAFTHPDKDKDKRSDFSQYQNFTIKTMKVDVEEMTSSMMVLKADSFEYAINLEPRKPGKVAFALSGIGYQSNYLMSNLYFRVTITGYKNDEIIYPSINLDQVNKHIHRDNNQLTFQSINGAVPVWFHEDVDSIRLHYSNSHSIILPQYLSIRGLQILEDYPVIKNPMMDPCKIGKNIMIAVEGGSSIEKKERKMVSSHLRHFIKNMNNLDDSSTLSFFEYGSEINSNTESRKIKSLLEAIRKYKKAKNQTRNTINSTNWSEEFEKASKTNPDVLIFITDSWNNWENGESASLSSMYQDLLIATNTLKSNGTRLIFLTLGMNPNEGLIDMLRPLLNGAQTNEHIGPIEDSENLHNIDLIALENIEDLSQVHLENFFVCESIQEDIVSQD